MCNCYLLFDVLYQGPGLLMSDDDTVLHGEFSDDWTVNGKVESSISFRSMCSVCLFAMLSSRRVSCPWFLLLRNVTGSSCFRLHFENELLSFST